MIIGTDQSALGTLVERSERFTSPLHLPRTEGCGMNRAATTARSGWLLERRR
jgi:hypothetical protein